MDPSQIKSWIDSLSSDEQKLLSDIQRLADEIGPHLLLEQVFLGIDLLTQYIQKLLPDIQCPSGCFDCCTEPLATFKEAKLIQTLYPETSFQKSEQCGFLKEGQCQVYSARPLECRAKGYFFEQKESALPMFQKPPEPFTCLPEKSRWQIELQTLENPVKYMFIPLLNKYRALLDEERHLLSHYFTQVEERATL